MIHMCVDSEVVAGEAVAVAVAAAADAQAGLNSHCSCMLLSRSVCL